MRLYVNDALVTPQADPQTVAAAVARLRESPEASVELRRSIDLRLRAVRAGAEGFFLEVWRSGMISGVFLPDADHEELGRAFREYLEGGAPNLVTEDAFDPDCPLCAMLAAQMKKGLGRA